jgi:hypothetical protein
VTSRKSWTGTCALILLKWSSWTKRSLTVWTCYAEYENFKHFGNCPYLSLTNYRCSKQNLWRWASFKCLTNLLISGVLLTRKRKIKHRICIHMIDEFILCFLYIFTGMRFALMQVKTGLCHILSRLEVAPHRSTSVPIAFDTKSFLLTIGGELPLTFKRLQLWNYIQVHVVLYVTN